MVEKHANTAIVFADLSGSTKLYLDVGDERAREIVAHTLDVWSSLTGEAGGSVIQLRGDGMLCMFPAVDAALQAAVRIRDLPYPPPVSMHADMHAGPVLHEAEQLYGDVVNVAARMADIARKFEIVLTAAARGQSSDSPHAPRSRLISGVPVKGAVTRLSSVSPASSSFRTTARRAPTRGAQRRAGARAQGTASAQRA